MPSRNFEVLALFQQIVCVIKFARLGFFAGFCAIFNLFGNSICG